MTGPKFERLFHLALREGSLSEYTVLASEVWSRLPFETAQAWGEFASARLTADDINVASLRHASGVYKDCARDWTFTPWGVEAAKGPRLRDAIMVALILRQMPLDVWHNLAAYMRDAVDAPRDT